MRIVSHDTRFDFQYELTQLVVYSVPGDGYEICGYSIGNSEIRFGSYSTEEACMEEMNNIREAYSRGDKVYKVRQ